MREGFLQKIADALIKSNEQDTTRFYVEHELSPSNIHIEVENLGKLSFPLSQSDIESLISLSSKAKFGLRDQTLLDETVRNTQEIPSDHLQVSIDNDFLGPMLTKISHTLGLSGGKTLTPHLHNLLIYGPGQFFNKHQDSEKLKGMVASLVIVLPSPHIGGNLTIEHNKTQHVFSSENIGSRLAKCVAFYADCDHEIGKIRQGYRVALTYNLVLEYGQLVPTEKPNALLKEAVKNYFDGGSSELVYFLDHDYTEHGLRWDLLKGSDRANASSLYAVAQELDLVPHLALVEIKESWTTDGNERNPRVEDLIDEETTLSYWIDSANQALPFGDYHVSSFCICWTKDTDTFEPAESEYEGYMGNYGDTMEYWYRRAALVLWPRSNQIAMNFKLNYDNSFNDLLDLTKAPGQEARAIEIIEKAGKYLHKLPSKQMHFEMMITLSLYIQDKDVALPVLSPFNWEILDTGIVKSLFNLQKLYGVDWCLDLMNQWKHQEKDYYRDYTLINILPLVRDFTEAGGDGRIVTFLLETQSSSLIKSDQRSFENSTPANLKSYLSTRVDKMLQMIEACRVAANMSVLNTMVEHLISNPVLYPLTDLANLFFTLQQNGFQKNTNPYNRLKDSLITRIKEQLNLEQRSEDDWSIEIKLPCKCEYCKTAMSFLNSKTDKMKVWPIVEHVRKHVMGAFHGMDLPVDVSIEKKGSPYKLVMVKNARLHEEAKERFDAIRLYHDKF